MKETIITKEIELNLNKENAKRMQMIDVVILVVIAIQIVSYLVSNWNNFGKELVWVKIAILIVGLLVFAILQGLRKEIAFLGEKSSYVIVFVSVLVISLGIVNTFVAQHITSDISIYIFIQMAILTGIRAKPRYILSILIPTYLFFSIGMFYFQTDSMYLTSHILNGALSNILGFVISSMFYHHSLKNIKDKIDIDEKNKMLKQLSEEDFLTGLYNKRSMYYFLEKFIEESTLDDNSIHLAILDLDHFKDINDLYGHLYGDEVLRSVGQKIKEHIREKDIATRYGGDEFVVIFKDTDEEYLVSIMKRILLEVSKIDFKSNRVNFSCGIATWQGESAEELFERADKLMYEVKHEGKNNVKKDCFEVLS